MVPNPIYLLFALLLILTPCLNSTEEVGYNCRIVYAVEDRALPDTQISAQVVLRPATGQPLDGDAQITAANIEEYLPSRQAVTAATAGFGALGFTVEAVAGNSFSIVAPAATFERVFDVQLQPDDKGSMQCLRADGTLSYELPLEGLPEAITSHVVTVTFVPAPDFGPTEFFGP